LVVSTHFFPYGTVWGTFVRTTTWPLAFVIQITNSIKINTLVNLDRVFIMFNGIN